MIKKNDNVIVITGGDKGKKGKVLKVLRAENRVVVEGINIKKHHQKSKQKNTPGQILEIPGSIHISNVKLSDAPKKAPAKTKTAKTAKKTS
ncbi:MAG: 50S ribosomal protein L24 [Candidatus Paceibacterota bacterium]